MGSTVRVQSENLSPTAGSLGHVLGQVLQEAGKIGLNV